MRFPLTIRVGLLWGTLRFRTRSFLARTGSFVAARRIPHAKVAIQKKLFRYKFDNSELFYNFPQIAQIKQPTQIIMYYFFLRVKYSIKNLRHP